MSDATVTRDRDRPSARATTARRLALLCLAALPPASAAPRATNAATAPDSPAAALARAQADESSLAPEAHTALVKAQAEALRAAMATCVSEPPSATLAAFTVVLQLDGSGRSRRSWLQGQGTIASCVEKALAQRSLFVPPRAPFYTFFEVSFEP